MKTELTNRARAALLHALHDLDEYEDHGGSVERIQEASRQAQVANAALLQLSRLAIGIAPPTIGDPKQPASQQQWAKPEL